HYDIAHKGCELTCYAMLFSYWLGHSITPSQLNALLSADCHGLTYTPISNVRQPMVDHGGNSVASFCGADLGLETWQRLAQQLGITIEHAIVGRHASLGDPCPCTGYGDWIERAIHSNSFPMIRLRDSHWVIVDKWRTSNHQQEFHIIDPGNSLPNDTWQTL